MATAEELLRNISDDEPHVIIDETRKITVPESLKRIAVESDHNIETVTFDCPRYWDNHDLSEMIIYINYKLSNGFKGSYIADNISVDGDVLHFTWTITRNVTQTKGNIVFLVCAKKTDAEGNEENHWNSELNTDMYVSEGLETDVIIEEEYPDVVTQLLERMSVIEDINNTQADIIYNKTTLIGGKQEDWSIAEFTPENGHKYDLIVEPFTVRSWLTSGYVILSITEYYTDGTSKAIVNVSVKGFDGLTQRVTIDNSSGNIAKVEVKLRPETNTEAYILFGDLESVVVADHKRLDETIVDINAVSRYFVYDKIIADFTSIALNSTYADRGPFLLNKPIISGQTVTFKIEAPDGDENFLYFNVYNGATRINSTSQLGAVGSRAVEYTNTLGQDITHIQPVLVKVIQQNSYTITIYDENSIVEKVEELSKSVEDISSGAVQVPDYYKDHLSGAISRAKTNLLNTGMAGETFVFISDLHWESNAKNSPSLIGAITNELPIENVIFGGDAFNGGEYEAKIADMNDIRKQFEKVSKRFLSLYGNHDSNYLDGGTGFTNREFYTMLQKQSDYYAVHHNPNAYYYFYMDNPTTKTRMIFLDSGQSNPSYASDEMSWLQSTVNDAPNGYNILVFSHIIYVPKSGGSYSDPTTWEMTTFMTDVCSYLDTVNTEGDKKVKAIFGGHSHYDYDAKTVGGIPIVLTDCDARQTQSGNNQALGSVNEQAFDIVTVNYKTNTVHCVRVGRGTDRTIQ